MNENECIDLAAMTNGGVALGATNAHYGRVSNLIAPDRAANMGEVPFSILTFFFQG